MAASPGRRPEQFGGKAEVKDRVMREMMKPIIFGNHQKKFKVFTFAVCTGKLYVLIATFIYNYIYPILQL